MSLSQAPVQVLHDISVPIFPGMPIYPGDPGVVFEPAMEMCGGALANVTKIHIGSQTGTHFDTPNHILNNTETVEKLPLSACYGPAQVIYIPDSVQAIDTQTLQQYEIGSCPRLLLKTRNSAFWSSHPTEFQKDFAALTEDGAEYLAAHRIELVGIDYLSIELFHSEGLKAHKALLEKNILILEGLNLSLISPGFYTLMAFPVLYQGLDGAPTRAVLMEER